MKTVKKHEHITLNMDKVIEDYRDGKIPGQLKKYKYNTLYQIYKALRKQLKYKEKEPPSRENIIITEILSMIHKENWRRIKKP